MAKPKHDTAAVPKHLESLVLAGVVGLKHG